MAQVTTIARQVGLVGEPTPIPVQLDPTNATPVYGTATPTHGIPRVLRFLAYRFPSYGAGRWLILLFADRVAETAEITREALTPGDQGLVVRHFWRVVRAHPAGTIATLAVPLLALSAFPMLSRNRRRALRAMRPL